jgi:hypothetical protein
MKCAVTVLEPPKISNAVVNGTEEEITIFKAVSTPSRSPVVSVKSAGTLKENPDEDPSFEVSPGRESAYKKSSADADFIIEIDSSGNEGETADLRQARARECTAKKCKAETDFVLELDSSDEENHVPDSKEIDKLGGALSTDCRELFTDDALREQQLKLYGDCQTLLSSIKVHDSALGRERDLTVLVGVGDGIIVESDNDYYSCTSGYSNTKLSARRKQPNGISPLIYDSDDYLSTSSVRSRGSLGSDTRAKYLSHLAYGLNCQQQRHQVQVLASTENVGMDGIVIAAPINGIMQFASEALQQAQVPLVTNAQHSSPRVAVADGSRPATTMTVTTSCVTTAATVSTTTSVTTIAVLPILSCPSSSPSIITTQESACAVGRSSADITLFDAVSGVDNVATCKPEVITSGSLYAANRQRQKKPSFFERGFTIPHNPSNAAYSDHPPARNTAIVSNTFAHRADSDMNRNSVSAELKETKNTFHKCQEIGKDEKSTHLPADESDDQGHVEIEMGDVDENEHGWDGDGFGADLYEPDEDDNGIREPLLAMEDTQKNHSKIEESAAISSICRRPTQINDFEGDSIYDFTGNRSVPSTVQPSSAWDSRSGTSLFGSFALPPPHTMSGPREMSPASSTCSGFAKMDVEEEYDGLDCIAFEMQDLTHIGAHRYSRDTDSVDNEGEERYSSDEFEEFRTTDKVHDASEDGHDQSEKKNKKKKKKKNKKNKKKNKGAAEASTAANGEAAVSGSAEGSHSLDLRVPEAYMPPKSHFVREDAIDILKSTVDAYKARFQFLQPVALPNDIHAESVGAYGVAVPKKDPTAVNSFSNCKLSSSTSKDLPRPCALPGSTMVTTAVTTTVTTTITTAVATSMTTTTSTAPSLTTASIASTAGPVKANSEIQGGVDIPVLQSTVASTKKKNKKKKKKNDQHADNSPGSTLAATAHSVVSLQDDSCLPESVAGFKEDSSETTTLDDFDGKLNVRTLNAASCDRVAEVAHAASASFDDESDAEIKPGPMRTTDVSAELIAVGDSNLSVSPADETYTGETSLPTAAADPMAWMRSADIDDDVRGFINECTQLFNESKYSSASLDCAISLMHDRLIGWQDLVACAAEESDFVGVAADISARPVLFVRSRHAHEELDEDNNTRPVQTVIHPESMQESVLKDVATSDNKSLSSDVNTDQKKNISSATAGPSQHQYPSSNSAEHINKRGSGYSQNQKKTSKAPKKKK